MKNKVLSFIIGVLVGAIVATAGYYFYAKNIEATSNQNGNGMQGMENMQEPPEMNGNMTPPEKPDGNNDQGEPPAKPDDEKENNTNNKNEKNNDVTNNTKKTETKVNNVN